MVRTCFLITNLLIFSSCSSFIKRGVASSTRNNEIIVVGESAEKLYFLGERLGEPFEIRQEAVSSSGSYSGYYRLLTYRESVLSYANCFRKIKGRIYDSNGKEKRGRLQGLKYLLVGFPDIPSEEVYQKNYYCKVYTKDVN